MFGIGKKHKYNIHLRSLKDKKKYEDKVEKRLMSEYLEQGMTKAEATCMAAKQVMKECTSLEVREAADDYIGKLVAGENSGLEDLEEIWGYAETSVGRKLELTRDQKLGLVYMDCGLNIFFGAYEALTIHLTKRCNVPGVNVDFSDIKIEDNLLWTLVKVIRVIYKELGIYENILPTPVYQFMELNILRLEKIANHFDSFHFSKEELDLFEEIASKCFRGDVEHMNLLDFRSTILCQEIVEEILTIRNTDQIVPVRDAKIDNRDNSLRLEETCVPGCVFNWEKGIGQWFQEIERNRELKTWARMEAWCIPVCGQTNVQAVNVEALCAALTKGIRYNVG